MVAYWLGTCSKSRDNNQRKQDKQDKKMKKATLPLATLLLAMSSSVFAIPTLQVHAIGSTAFDGGNDEDSWLIQSTDFDLELIGTFGPNTTSITNAYLVVTAEQNASNIFNSGSITKYDDASAFEATLAAIDPDLQTNNHAPYGSAADLIDIYAFDLGLLGGLGATELDGTVLSGSFSNSETTKNCDASIAGTTDCTAAPNSLGEIKTLRLSTFGLSESWLHFDLVALVTDSQGNQNWVSTWEINPGSHDTTWMATGGTGPLGNPLPAPATIALMGLGLIGLGATKRRKKA